MNPNNTIRPWLLACGKQFGIRYAYHMRWPDADNKPDEMFVTYQIMSSKPDENDQHGYSRDTASGNDVVQRANQSWQTLVRVELHNSQNGVQELASMCTALNNHTTMQILFQKKATILDARITDRSEFDDEEILYLHRLEIDFRESISHELTDTNGLVETIRIQLDDGTWYDQYDITKSGITPTT